MWAWLFGQVLSRISCRTQLPVDFHADILGIALTKLLDQNTLIILSSPHFDLVLNHEAERNGVLMALQFVAYLTTNNNCEVLILIFTVMLI